MNKLLIKMKMLQMKKIAFAIILIVAGTVSAFAQRDDRDKGQREPHLQNNNQRPQQHVTRQPQRQPAVNRTPVNRQVPNRTTVNRTQINRTQVNVNRTQTINRTTNVRSYANRPGYRPHGWASTRRPYTRPPVVYGGRSYYAYHRYYAHPYVAFSYGPRWHPVGFFLSALVGTAILIDLENQQYRYDAGVFYAPYNNGYQVVSAPPGAYVPSIPEGYQQVAVGGQTYYYFGGAFFVLNGNQYEVVQAPAGAVVYNLPQGASPAQVDDYNYMQYNGTYYQPIQINGQDAYEVVEMEDASQPQQ
jgi:hypothetical protein